MPLFLLYVLRRKELEIGFFLKSSEWRIASIVGRDIFSEDNFKLLSL